MAKVVTFGELMIRLQPYNYERFVQASNLEFTFGGGEANVAVSLANYGFDAAYVTKLPAHAIGQSAVNSLRRYGVDTSNIVRGGDRVGIYLSRKLIPPSLTGTRSSKALTGSTSPESLPLWARTWWKPASRPARQPKSAALRSAAT